MRKSLSILAACLVCVCVFFVGNVKAVPSAGVGGDGGGSTYQPCDYRYWGHRIFMNDTDEGIFGIRYYRCVQGGGVIHWDRIHSAYFNTGGNYIQGAWNCWGGGCDEWIPD
jgi:hypothetical protein